METCPPEKWKEAEEKVKEELSKYKTSQSCFTWVKSTCPDCGTENWIDMTCVKVEGCECFNCKKTFWISEDIYDDYQTTIVMSRVFNSVSSDVEEYIFKGLKKPE